MANNLKGCRSRLAGRLLLAAAAAILTPLLLNALLAAAGYGYASSFVRTEMSPDGPILRENSAFSLLCFRPGAARLPAAICVDTEPGPDAYRVVVLGESAAMGDPMPAFGLARCLEVMLQAAMPEREVTVVNAAMTAIDSSVIRRIAGDLPLLDPDVVVVYAGNNEIVGPFGPDREDNVFTRLGKARPQLTMALRSTRLVQFLRDVAYRIRPAAAGASWRGMEMFEQRLYEVDDPEVVRARERFGANLEAILDNAHHAGARTVLATMATRLTFPPFHPDGPAKNRDGESATEHPSAADAYAEARKSAAAGQWDAARSLYHLSRDLDRLRFRADSGIQEEIRSRAESADVFMDAEELFDREYQAQGRLFVDHVHLSLEGNLKLARAMAEALVPGAEFPEDRTCRERLLFTWWDEMRLVDTIHARLTRPPYALMSEAEELVAPLTDALRRLRRGMRREDLAAVRDYLAERAASNPRDVETAVRCGILMEALEEHESAEAIYRSLLAIRPGDRNALSALARLAAVRGDFERAVELFASSDPHNPLARQEACLNAGALAAEQGDIETADRWFARAEAAGPPSAMVRYNQGLLASRRGDHVGAEAHYRASLALNPSFTEARNNLGISLLQRGKRDEAAACFHKVLAVNPLHISALRNLAGYLQVSGNHREASEFLQTLSRIDPSWPYTSP